VGHWQLATGVSINAGISFNSIRLNDQYRTFFGPGTEVRIDASNSFAARPQIRFEFRRGNGLPLQVSRGCT
jgi:hypothetical protein